MRIFERDKLRNDDFTDMVHWYTYVNSREEHIARVFVTFFIILNMKLQTRGNKSTAFYYVRIMLPLSWHTHTHTRQPQVLKAVYIMVSRKFMLILCVWQRRGGGGKIFNWIIIICARIFRARLICPRWTGCNIAPFLTCARTWTI